MAYNFKRIIPSATMPELIAPFYEYIDYNAVIGKKTNYGQKGDDVLYYMKVDAISANTVVGGSSMWRNDIVKNDGAISQRAVPYYKVDSSYTTDDYSEAKWGRLGLNVSEKEFKEKITLQAMAQRRAHITFFGADASENQGLFNAASETVALPTDSGSHTTLVDYIPGELLEFLISQIREVANLSYNMLKPIVIVAPINAINYIKTKIVPYTNYFENAGTIPVSNVIDSIVINLNGMSVKFVPCSYMAGKGTGNKDVMLIIAPGTDIEEGGKEDTNYFNSISSSNSVNTFMDDIINLQTYDNPIINQVFEKVYTSIYTPAYTVREDAVRAIEYTYSN